MPKKYIFALLLLSGSTSFFSQQLMINEVSQGTGGGEYVEFVVIGNPICENETVPCIDIRKVIIDDNNGFFATGGGTGIASGALRFSNDSFWSCIPQGTYIVIYNEADRNSSLPPDDLSLSDGNCMLIIPGNSGLLESTTTSPTASPSNPLYPSDSNWGASTGWTPVTMNNSDDSFQIPNLGINGTPLHSVSWGNNTTGSIIYFPGPVNGQVISFKNLVNNDFNDQQNWVIEPIASAQTPGFANSPENDQWIGTMNPDCRVNSALDFVIQNSSCGQTNGSLTVSLSNSTNISVVWETNEITETISGLAPDTYTVTVTDLNTSCIYVDSATVVEDNNGFSIAITQTNESCSNFCDATVQYLVSGGQTPYTVNWFDQNNNDISEPSNFCSGNYSIEVTDVNGCQLQEIITIIPDNPFEYTISNDATICLDDSIIIFTVGTTNPSSFSYLWSTGEITDSILVNPKETTLYTVVITSGGCSVQETVQIAVYDCSNAVDFPNIFTPNQDGKNDEYIPLKFDGVINEEFVILNRWGIIMYQTNSQQIKWDGKSQDGKEASEGVYFYKCLYHNSDFQRKIAQGFIQLKRN